MGRAMKRAALLLAASLAGCVVVTPVHAPGSWSHETASAEQTKVDAEICEKEGWDYATEVGNPYVVFERQRECMRAKSYRWIPGPASP